MVEQLEFKIFLVIYSNIPYQSTFYYIWYCCWKLSRCDNSI